MKVYTGSYIGDGTSGHKIAVPFDPDLVIVKRDGASAAVWRTTAMTEDSSCFFGASADLSDGILTNGTNEFTVGVNAAVNTAGQVYYFTAFQGESGDLEVGSYTGNATDDRDVSWSESHAAAPRLMWIKEEDSADAVVMRDFADTGDSSTVLTTTPSLAQTNRIQAVNSTVFQVGTSTDINVTEITYYYVAFFADDDVLEDGTYTGNATSDRLIEGLAVNPGFVFIRDNTTATEPFFRTSKMLGDKTVPLISAATSSSGKVKNIYKDKFQLGSDDAVNKSSDSYVYFAWKVTDWSVSSKYHISLDGTGYNLQTNRNGRPLYEKKPAPEFVGKFGSGDSSYRDSSFWQFWAQVNWRNGSKQLRFDDAGKFWKSENVDVSQLEKITLSKKMVSAGQVEANAKITAQSSFRASQNWWNDNYLYRKKITITADEKQLPVGYPITITEDTAALESASKVRSDRKDWRVLYWNGTIWEDLTIDYVSTTRTVFALKAAIDAESSRSDYYIYYGYSAESTTKQASTDEEYNSVYAMFGTEFDANTIAVWHFREGSGTTIADDDAAHDLTASGSMGWVTSGPFGRAGNFTGNNDMASVTSNDFNLGSITIEAWVKTTSSTTGMILGRNGGSASIRQWALYLKSNGKLEFWTDFDGALQSTTSINDGNWHHVVGTHNGSNAKKVYVDGVEENSSNPGSAILSTTGAPLEFGRKTSGGEDEFDGYIAHTRISNTARSSFPYGIGPSDVPVLSMGSEEETQPPTSSFAHLAGTSTGKVYSSDGAGTWTELFDTRRLEWYDDVDLKDSDRVVGDTGGTETAQAQSFQVDETMQVKAVQVYIDKAAGTPSDLQVRIETNGSSVPSGTLVDAALNKTVAVGDIGSDYAWLTVEFDSAVQLTADTTYWLVLKTAAAANDQNYTWGVDASSPTYGQGNMADSSDGGSTWSAQAARDALFRILGNTTAINCSLISAIDGTQKVLWGVGNVSSEITGDARIYSYDGSSWALEHSFASTSFTESSVLSLAQYKVGGVDTLFAGVGCQGRIYKSTDLSTWTISVDVESPQNPGYPYALFPFNRLLYSGGGSPEFLDDKNYNGFFYQFNQVDWEQVFPFDYTILKSIQFYDAFLFIGSYHGQLFVFNTVTLDPLFSFSDDYNYKVQIPAMFFYDDKLWIGLAPQTGVTPADEGLWTFNRHGMHQTNKISGVSGYYSFAQVNNNLYVGTGDDGYVYKLEREQYEATGSLQTSYFDALLPSINKLYNEFTIQYDPLPTGTSINVYYKFKESESWTQLGDTISTPNSTSATLTFPSGTLSKKVSFKIELITTDSSVTPGINEYVLKYSLYPTRKWQWNMRVLAKDFPSLLDGTRDPRTGLQIMTDVAEAQQAERLNTFVDVDGKSYTVLFHALDQDSWVVNQNDEGNESTIAITLLEA